MLVLTVAVTLMLMGGVLVEVSAADVVAAMEKLDWKMFLSDVRACNSDDMSEFAP